MKDKWWFTVVCEPTYDEMSEKSRMWKLILWKVMKNEDIKGWVVDVVPGNTRYEKLTGCSKMSSWWGVVDVPGMPGIPGNVPGKENLRKEF